MLPTAEISHLNLAAALFLGTWFTHHWYLMWQWYSPDQLQRMQRKEGNSTGSYSFFYKRFANVLQAGHCLDWQQCYVQSCVYGHSLVAGCMHRLHKINTKNGFSNTSNLPQKHLSRGKKRLEPLRFQNFFSFCFPLWRQASITLPAFPWPTVVLCSALSCTYPLGCVSCTALPCSLSISGIVAHGESLIFITTLSFLLHLLTPSWMSITNQIPFSFPTVKGKTIIFSVHWISPNTEHQLIST